MLVDKEVMSGILNVFGSRWRTSATTDQHKGNAEASSSTQERGDVGGGRSSDISTAEEQQPIRPNDEDLRFEVLELRRRQVEMEAQIKYLLQNQVATAGNNIRPSQATTTQDVNNNTSTDIREHPKISKGRTSASSKQIPQPSRRRPVSVIKDKISIRYMCKHLKCTVGKDKRCRGIVNITLRRGEPRPPLTNMPLGVAEDCDWETLVKEHTRSVNRRSNDKTGASKEIEVDGTRPWYGRVGNKECFFLRERQKVRTHNNKEHNKVHPEEGYDRINQDHGDLYVTDKGYDNVRYQGDKRTKKMKATTPLEDE